jgi:hypothetical protein
VSWLAEHCPRLHRAHRARRARLRWLAGEQHQLEKLIAHRELQLLRAGNTGDRRYVNRRADKLERARGRLEQVRRERGVAA